MLNPIVLVLPAIFICRLESIWKFPSSGCWQEGGKSSDGAAILYFLDKHYEGKRNGKNRIGMIPMASNTLIPSGSFENFKSLSHCSWNIRANRRGRG